MITINDGILIFIICVGIPIGYGIGYFGLMFILSIFDWRTHKNYHRSPYEHNKYRQVIGSLMKPISTCITLQLVGPREEKDKETIPSRKQRHDMFELIISDKELQQLYEFSKKHHESLYKIKLIQTGIGTKIIIEDTYNHNQEDVSDYDAW